MQIFVLYYLKKYTENIVKDKKNTDQTAWTRWQSSNVFLTTTFLILDSIAFEKQRFGPVSNLAEHYAAYA